MKTIRVSGNIGSDGFGAADLAEAINAHDQVHIVLNSDGGCIRAAGAIADLVDEHALPVEVLRAVSAAAIIATAGPARTIAADGYIATHPAWRAVAGGHRELNDAAKELRQVDALLDELLSKRSRLNRQQTAQAIRSGRVWTARQALDDQLVDHIGAPAGLDTPPESIVDGPAREHFTLRGQAKHYLMRAAREREIHTETADTLDDLDCRMSALVEACSPPARLARIFDHAAGDAKLRHLYPGRERTPSRWRCDRCGHLNFTPPAIGYKPAACINCNATGGIPDE